MNNNSNKKVFVGVSGGVDSSVSAALLKEQSYDVTGVFIKAWHPTFLPCNWRSEMRDAMRVCARLKIPFLLCDLEKEYKTEVIDYLISEYKAGHTPNPDVFCNKEIKFGHFLKWAEECGANYVATGHYAQSIKDEKSKKVKLIQGKDRNKDQTYFLWTLTQNKLKKVLFPIGHIEKPEVRKIAKKFNLHTSSKKDSQGLCFVGHVDMKLFLKRFIKTEPGNVLNKKGEIIGSHQGAELYTFGQRHGFIINEDNKNKKNYYVIDKNLEKNQIIVSENPKSIEKLDKIFLQDVSFTREELFGNEKIDLEIKPRYRSPNFKAILNKKGEDYILETIKLKEKIAPGQSIVFYLGNECIGGGIVA